jgi:hypothetical protein
MIKNPYVGVVDLHGSKMEGDGGGGGGGGDNGLG